MKSRWWSARALRLHGLLIAWIGGCVSASVWQVGRALQGNKLSDLYSFEWPMFAVLGVVGWWALVHTDPAAAPDDVDGATAEDRARVQAAAAREVERGGEDETLAAYNDHLAQLADEPKRRLFGH